MGSEGHLTGVTGWIKGKGKNEPSKPRVFAQPIRAGSPEHGQNGAGRNAE